MPYGPLPPGRQSSRPARPPALFGTGRKGAAPTDAAAAGLDVVTAFARMRLRVMLTPIRGVDRVRRYGHLRAPSGATLHVARQPVDPARYPQNFVEVFQVTTDPRDRGGFQELARTLLVAEDVLAAVQYTDHRAHPVKRAELGVVSHLRVSLTSIDAAAYTVFVNPDPASTQHLYVYGRGELLGHVRAAMPTGLRRGSGRSNEDTFAVLVPLPVHRWQRDGDGGWWSYTGTGVEKDALARLRDQLAEAEPAVL